jgi:hypothetical protein
MSMNDNIKTILTMVFWIAIPIGLLGFVLGSVIPRQMGLEAETRTTLSLVIPSFAGMVSTVLCMVYAMKRTRKNVETDQPVDE